ncbi:TLC domain-containing protein 3A-like [Montipora capricornis]|uniref:TLC domain-containing protein 3A-like n=1 Tax=Montipora capricornis TaxID=246305 RepID=UPI0035F1A6AC
MDGLYLFTAGLFFFPLSHILSTYFQKFIFTNIAYVDRFAISTRFVSALQALAASAVGLKVALTSTDIMLHRQPVLTQYACFGLSYFYYDVVVMFIEGYLDEKHGNPQGDLHYKHVWSKLFKKKKLIILHHLLLPIFGFPAVTMWRRSKGDFFLACVYLNEMSTPFLSLKAILDKLGMRKSTLYVTNGVLLATVFLFCRVLVYPYMYWCYSRYAGISILSTPLRIPVFCNTFCFFLFSIQVYWFVIIMKGVLRFYQGPANMTEKTPTSEVCLNGENGFLHKNHHVAGDGKVMKRKTSI